MNNTNDSNKSTVPTVNDTNVPVEKKDTSTTESIVQSPDDTIKISNPDVVPTTDSIFDSVSNAISSSNSVGNNTNTNTDTSTNTSIEENANENKDVFSDNKLKRVEVDYKPPGFFKKLFMFLFLGGLIAFVFFLPDIKKFVDSHNSSKNGEEEPEITTGKLICNLKKNSETLDYKYDVVFKFTDKKLQELSFTKEVRGDITLDEDELNAEAAICKQLASNVEDMGGVSVKCTFSKGKLTEKNVLYLQNIDYDELDAAYFEAGGNNPGYKFEQDIDEVEKGMYATGYSCTREEE